ncbi:DUF2971 domain-containing protein [Candidatus Poribacteria bacterium]|nr:DUF2971 domain-containing protein [Candidatus Poribacteria bacterium]
MVLYKYLPAKRVDILQRHLIRFSQPAALNDPFESLPYFHAIATEAGSARAFAETIRQMSPTMWEDFRTEAQTNLDQQAFADRVEGDPARAANLYNEVCPNPVPNARKKMYQQINRTVGILSLSEVRDNLLMWAHYADNHAGFVIMLDGSHDFFKTGDSTIGFAEPERVRYRAERPRTTFEEVTEFDIFLVKSTHWMHEQEWRYLKYLRDADERIENTSLPVYLFRLPPECIRGVILGSRASADLQDKILALRHDDPELGHLRVLRAGLDGADYLLRVKELEA